ncbi:hypothetical protein BFX40_28645 [Mesorhizobium sp. SEMIA 3007]|uniref:Uncharacterized protein n=2 Tax=Mesorhizobium TaxID=68287 RepID=A0A1A5JBI7_RHILI|nr:MULTISPECIES: hypothetical protein [Mesorhizobium]MBE1710986.1 hypothetical protein [Mesorhizobium japonicum]MBE1715346.1 hypothetical protein [Mesorhizobium japonicum]MUT21932.1 hypothetical protein [Mesorhizobium japonicum]MUT27783.1 hypothetical protein [Mesorhizobium japonicum]OBP78914.1 hypothetical protein BAE39_29325 [Mesorhizobium loti]
MDSEDLEIFAGSDDTSYECLQIAPMGNGRCAILFLLSDPDYASTISVVFVVDDFNPASARGILLTEDWLMSLTCSPSGELFALEATVWIWRYDGKEWRRTKISEIDLRRVWAKADVGPLVVGSEGRSYLLSGDRWIRLKGLPPVQFFDLHGDSKNGIHTCGEDGSLFKLVGQTWRPLELHRGDQFRGLDVAPDGSIRLAGDNGVCLQITTEEIVELETSGLTHFAVRSFHGKAYWGDEAGVYVQKGRVLDPLLDTEIGSDLRADHQFLYCAGADTAWRFDGKEWKTLTLVYDGGFRLEE